MKWKTIHNSHPLYPRAQSIYPIHTTSTYYLEISHSTSFNILFKLSTLPTHVPQSIFALNVTVLQTVLLSKPPVVKITQHVSIDVTTVAFLCNIRRHRHGEAIVVTLFNALLPPWLLFKTCLVCPPTTSRLLCFFCLKGSRTRSS